MRGIRPTWAGLLALVLLAGCGAPADSTREFSGVYLLDREDFALRLLAERTRAHEAAHQSPAGEERRRRWYEDSRRTASSTDLRLDLLADGRFVVRYRFGSEEGRRRGSWRRDGIRVALITTHTPSGPMPESSEIVLVWSEGALECPSSPEVPHAFRLRPR